VRLPLFTVISGYLYAVRPVSAGALPGFLQGKARRLLLPLFCVSTLEYLALAFAPGVNNPVPAGDVWRVWVYSFEHYWFLQAIALIFLLVGFLESRSAIAARRAFWVFFGLSLLTALVCFTLVLPAVQMPGYLDVFSIVGALGLLPYFIWGMAIQRFPDALFDWRVVLVAAVVLAIAIALREYAWRESWDGPIIDKAGPVGYLFGLSVSLLLFARRPSVPFLARIGGYSFTVYLFQAFGTAIGRRLFDIPDINPHAYYVLVLSFAVCLGILVEVVVRRIPIASPMFLGVPFRPRSA
jgi:fucose 4-O-acetylase-like acetyltransferase